MNGTHVFHLLCDTLVDEGSKFDVVVAQPLTVVGGQGDLDFVVNVEPLGMVVHLVGLKENDSHVTINNIEHNKPLTSQSYTFSRM